MSDVKFSQFTTGGDMRVGDTVVGLRGNTNTIYTFPGLGIQDKYGNYLFQYETAATIFESVNFLVLTNSQIGSAPSLTVAGSDINIPLVLNGKGTGPIVLSGQDWPITDGLFGQVLSTDGAGHLSWANESGTGTVNSALANEIAFYASSGDTVSGINPTLANAVLVTDGTTLPSMSNTLPSAVQLNITGVGIVTSGNWNASIIDVPFGGTGLSLFVPYALVAGGTAAGNPLQQVSGLGNAAQILTSQGPGLLPIWADNTAAGFTWNNITIAGPTTLADKNGYMANAVAQTLFRLPPGVLGDFFSIAGSAASGWQVQASAGQVMNLGNTPSSSGGTMTSTNQFDQVDILCTGVSPDVFVVRAPVGDPDLL